MTASEKIDDYSNYDVSEKGQQQSTQNEKTLGSEFYDPYTDTNIYAHDAPQLTFRAVFAGVILGSIVCASNTYLGLKTGFSFGAQLFGAIFGYGMIRIWVFALSRMNVSSNPFGPKENCTIQTVATAAGGLSCIFTSGIPAMYKLGLLTTPGEDIVRLMTLTLCGAYFGLFFAVPLRQYFVVQNGSKFRFPTPFASAETINTLHADASGSEGNSRAKWMAISFVFAMLYKVFGKFVPGVFTEWHLMYWFGTEASLAAENWGWVIEWTPCFIGAGMLSGMNASASYFGGTVLSWGIMGPLLVAAGWVDTNPGTFLGMPKEKDAAGNFVDMTKSPTARYWLLWPAILMMLVASFTELALNGKTVAAGISGFFKSKFGKKNADADRTVIGSETPKHIDAPVHQQVPTLWWTGGVLLSIIVCIVVLRFQFEVAIELTILSIVLGFVLAFVGIQSSATTDINPIGICAKVSQLVLGGVSSSRGDFSEHAQRINLIGGVISAASAAQSVDMVGDLKTGHLVGASPRAQFLGQIIGSFVAIFTAVGFFLLFASANPCILSPEADKTCPFKMPSVEAWKGITQVVTSNRPSIPPASGYTAIIMACIAFVFVVFQSRLPAAYRTWVPNMNGIGMGFLTPGSNYSFAMLLGATLSDLWAKFSPRSFEFYAFSVASGLIAGEGIGGVIEAALAIFQIDLTNYGSEIGMPE